MNEEIGLFAPVESGDEAARPENWVHAAIEQYEDPLLRYARHFVGDLETARDIVQDTFLQLCRKPDEGLRPHLARWLFAVCRNRAIDVCRKESRMSLVPENQLADVLSKQTQDANESSPAAAIEKRETSQGLMDQVTRLPDRQQEILRLKFSVGLSYQEIAEVMGLSRTNVGFILHSAISKLRQRLVQQ